MSGYLPAARVQHVRSIVQMVQAIPEKPRTYQRKWTPRPEGQIIFYFFCLYSFPALRARSFACKRFRYFLPRHVSPLLFTQALQTYCQWLRLRHHNFLRILEKRNFLRSCQNLACHGVLGLLCCNRNNWRTRVHVPELWKKSTICTQVTMIAKQWKQNRRLGALPQAVRCPRTLPAIRIFPEPRRRRRMFPEPRRRRRMFPQPRRHPRVVLTKSTRSLTRKVVCD